MIWGLQNFQGENLVKSNRLLIVVLISLIIIGVVILTNIVSFSNIEKLVISQLKDNQLVKTEYAASQIESHILQVKEELTTLSQFPVMETLDVSKCTGNMRMVHESVEKRIDSLLRADKDGNIIECSTPDFSNYVGMNIKNKAYFSEPKETNEPFITGMARQGSSREIIVSAPLFETTGYTPYPNFLGEFKGVLLSIIEVNNLYNLYIHPILDEDKNMFLLINLDTEETILKSGSVQDYTDIKAFLPEKSGNWNMIADFDGFGKTIITSSDLLLGSETWRLIILTPLSNVGGDILSVQKRHFFSLAFVIIIIITVFFFVISLYRSKEEVQSKLEKASVTLEKLGINIEVEKDKYSQADINLDPGKVYLVKEDDENHAHELFINTLNRGFAGLGIVRENPETIRKRYNLEKTSFIWLADAESSGAPCETNIDNLFRLISEFIKKSEKSAILLDRTDYIISENRFEEVIKIIHALKDLAQTHECIIIIAVNPELIEEPQLKAIEAETIDLYGKHLKGKAELTGMEMKILRYVNDKNIINNLASYKDITDEFGITKPTTRARISRLQGLGLLQVEQRGRFKSLKVTSAGRRIIK